MKSAEGVSLKEHIESRLAALENATSLSARAMEKRLESMNEFRAQLKDQSSTFLTRVEHDAYAALIQKDIQSLRESRATLEGKATQNSVLIAYVISAIGIALGIAGMLK